ncbi:GntR family transcriptional regulator [Tenacibaculum adriaticum]|uniref:GntR family transcriptional regulator n=1 Tax=Tenacibaculum adriaticum TaxID=413713 RepID=A0A5S5DPW3_9FLAO|nr:PLP-dependent aminotransferase family protein [Tenacibaculum adriaticum]TYP97418.1 GntR family transcriptional regulator [Tenacibaculum adriaticum]
MDTNNRFTIQRIQKEYQRQKQNVPSNKYIILYKAIKECILNIELPHDWLLPPTRILAQEIGLSRTTVIKAYELLLLEKLIFSKPGSGNRINYENTTINKSSSKQKEPVNINLYPDISQKGQSYLKNISLINRLPNKSLAFRPGLPPLDVFPVNQWKKLLNTYWRHIKSSGLSYSQSTGLHELKKSICNYLNVSRNIKCDAKQVMIVSGSLQSLYLITNAIIDKDDSVVLENPLFPNVHSIFKSSQANLIPIELDSEGININKMNTITHNKPKVVHVTPSNHYPLGIQMSLKRRKEILEWASKNKAFVIENDYENEIANSSNSIPTIYSLDTEDRTIYMGTFNRLLHPSIRLGYMIIPRYLVKIIEALQEHSHRFISPSIQVVMNQFIEKNYLYQHIKNSIEVARERHDLFITEFESISKTMYVQQKPFSSFHLLAYFKSPVSEEYETEIIKKLNENDIIAFPLSKCYITSPKKQGLILGYSSVRPAVLKQKIKKLAGII